MAPHEPNELLTPAADLLSRAGLSRASSLVLVSDAAIDDLNEAERLGLCSMVNIAGRTLAILKSDEGRAAWQALARLSPEAVDAELARLQRPA